MGCLSIMFEAASDRAGLEPSAMSEVFHDLHIEQIIAAVTAGRAQYRLEEFLARPLRSADDISYRQEVMRDFENQTLFEQLAQFAERMRSVRDHLTLSDKLYYQPQKDAWRLDAIAAYCEAVAMLAEDLSAADLQSSGLSAFRAYLTKYVRSAAFAGLDEDTRALQRKLASVRYSVLIRQGALDVRRFEDEPDYSAEVEQTFEKFKQGEVKDYRTKFDEFTEMDHIEAQIMDFVIKLHPDIFASLKTHLARHLQFIDEVVSTFDREAQFYAAWLEYAAKFKRAGLTFCYPRLSSEVKSVFCRDGFDLALVDKLLRENKPVVCNDFEFNGNERIIVVTGPNQGGKTTFARMFGQMHFFASLGCPVPGAESRLFLFDRIFTHFEREEEAATLRGKLQEDLLRIHAILEEATSASIIVLNEIFTSTTLQDALFLGGKVMDAVFSRDLLCVWVTFLDELASANGKTVSMMSTVVPGSPSLRSFKIIRKPADGLSYALSLAESRRLTYPLLKERLRP